MFSVCVHIYLSDNSIYLLEELKKKTCFPIYITRGWRERNTDPQEGQFRSLFQVLLPTAAMVLAVLRCWDWIPMQVSAVIYFIFLFVYWHSIISRQHVYLLYGNYTVCTGKMKCVSQITSTSSDWISDARDYTRKAKMLYLPWWGKCSWMTGFTKLLYIKKHYVKTHSALDKVSVANCFICDWMIFQK